MLTAGEIGSKHIHDLNKVILCRDLLGGFGLFVPQLWVRPCNQQFLHDVTVPVHAGKVQGSLPIAVHHIQFGVLLCKDIIDNSVRTDIGGPVQGSAILLVPGIDLEGILKTEEHFHLLPLCGEMQEGHASLGSLFKISTFINQVVDNFKMASIRSIMQGCEAFIVHSIYPWFYSRFVFG